MTIGGADQDAVAQLSVMAMDAACQPDLIQTCQRVADLAAKLIPCAAADIVQYRAHYTLHVTASSDQSISGQLAAALQQWPHDPYLEIDSIGGQLTVQHPDRYLLQVRRRAGVVAEMTFPLRVDHTDHGFLRFLLRQPVAPRTADSRLGAAFAAHAAIALDRAALRATVHDLSTAIAANREIGSAVGILMARGGISYDAGFQLLKSTSQNNNRKLRDVVAAVLYTGELPSYPIPHRPAAAT